MWAQVIDNEVVRLMAHPMEIVKNGIKYPKSIFTKWSVEDLIGLGVYPYSENKVDHRYHNAGAVSYTIDSDSVTGLHETSARDVADYKEKMIQRSKEAASGLLAKHDWMAIREMEGGEAMPADVKTYRAAVRAESNTKEAEINALTDMDAVMAYEAVSYTEVRKVWDNAANDWSSDTSTSNRLIEMTTYYEAVDPTAPDPAFVSLTKD